MKTYCKDCIKPCNTWNTSIQGLHLFVWGFCFSWLLCLFGGFRFLLRFFCNQIVQIKLPIFKNKIYFTYFWNSSGLESGSRFFFHLFRDLSVMSFSPGISGIPMALANRCAPWSVSSMCFVCRKTRDSLTILILSFTEQFCITTSFRSIHTKKIPNFIFKISKFLSISPSTIAEKAFSSPNHKV